MSEHTPGDNNLSSQDESGLCNDLGFLAHLPELCDITFLVGEDKEPVCAVRAVLGSNTASLSILDLIFIKIPSSFLPLLSLTYGRILGEFLLHKKILCKFTF